MARGVKGSGKVNPKGRGKAAPTVASEQAGATKAPRKPYPTLEERIAMGNAAVSRLTALCESRGKLIEKTEAALAERKEALARVTADLEKTKAKQDKLLLLKDKKSDASSTPAQKLSAEERKAARLAAVVAAREAKKARKEKMDQLMEKLDQSGLTLDEAFEKLEK